MLNGDFTTLPRCEKCKKLLRPFETYGGNTLCLAHRLEKIANNKKPREIHWDN